MRIRQKILLSLFAVFLFAVGVFATSYYISHLQDEKGLLINMAGRQRTLSQMVVKHFLAWEYAQDDEQRLQWELRFYDSLLNFKEAQIILLQGGLVLPSFRKMGQDRIDPILGDAFIQQNAARSIAVELFSAMKNAVKAGNQVEAYDPSLDARLLMSLSNSVEALQQDFKENAQLLIYVQGVGFFFALCALLLAFGVLLKGLWSPFLRLMAKLQKESANEALHPDIWRRTHLLLLRFKRQLFLLFVLFVLSFTSFLGAWLLGVSQQKDAHQINVSGRQRMLTQKILKRYLILAMAETSIRSKEIALLSEDMSILEETHRALKEGGDLPELIIKRQTPWQFFAAYGEPKRQLFLITPLIENFLEPIRRGMREPSLFSLREDQSERDLLAALDDLTYAFQAQSSFKRKLELTGVLVGILLSLLAFLCAWCILRPQYFFDLEKASRDFRKEAGSDAIHRMIEVIH